MGTEKIYEALEYASSVFSPGTVWTDLILGPGSQDKFKDVYETGLKLHSIKLWETPSSYALYETHS